MPYATVNGRKAFYQCPRDVAGGEVRGKVVLLVHGAGGNRTIWAPQMQALALDHTLLGIDLPGHGNSEGPGATAVSEYRDFVKGLVDSLGLTSFVIAGHSMGGSIALDYALHYPGVEALIPVGAAAKWDIPKEVINLWRTNPDEARRASAERSFAKKTPGSIIELNMWNNRTTDVQVQIDDLEACSKFDVVANLRKISVPTCIICGEEDAYVNGSRVLHASIPGSRVEWIKDAGHDPSIEQPLATNRLFRDFLDSLP